MKIDHIALYVSDLETMKDFYETYFNALHNTLYHNPRTGLKTYFLSFDDGSRLEIMTRPDMTLIDRRSVTAGYAHLAMGVGSKAGVERITDRLRQDGYTVVSGPRGTGDGCYESCVKDPEGNLIEIVE